MSRRNFLPKLAMTAGFLWLLFMLFTVSGCGTAKPMKNEAGKTSPASNRLVIVDGPFEWRGGWTYIVKDKETEQEFIFIDGPESVAVCPISAARGNYTVPPALPPGTLEVQP